MTYAEDPRPFRDVLLEWAASHKWSGPEAAKKLRVPYFTWRNWVRQDGRARECYHEYAVRVLMDHITREQAK